MSRIKKFKLGDTVYDVGPNKTSELQNDAGFITSASLPTKVSDLTNDSGFITEDDVAVDDVQINGTSIVNENKVANIPIPNNGRGLGVVGTHEYYGLQTITSGNDFGLMCGVVKTYANYTSTDCPNTLVISKGTLENVLTEKGFLTENEAVTKTATGTQTIKSQLFLGGLTTNESFGNAVTHQRKLATVDSQGRTLYGAGFQVGYPSGACELISKTWDDAGASGYSMAVLRMSPNGLAFGVNGAPGRTHTVPTEAEYKKVALADDLSIVKSDKDLILKHGSTELSRASSAIPTKTSELTNDSGFITSTALPTKVSDLNNDSGFLTTANIATSQTPGVIKSGYQLSVASDGTPSCGTLTKTSYASANNSVFISKGTLANILTDYALSSSVPTKTSDLTNDSDFLTENDISGVYLSTSDEADQDIIKSANSHNKYLSPWYQAQSVFYGLAEASGYSSHSSMTYGTYPTNAKNLIKDLLGCSKTSDFTNDAGFITSDALPTKVSDLTNDSGFLSMPWYYQTEGPSVDASNMINMLLLTYGKVVLGPGTYYVKYNITLRKNQTIEGCGPQTIIEWNGIVTSGYRIIRVISNDDDFGPDRICIKNLCIKGIDDSDVVTNIDFTSSTIPSTVPIGIEFYTISQTSATLKLDQPIIIENVLMENLSIGLKDNFCCGYDTNPYLTSQQYEPASDRLHVNGCTFRNCYIGYYDEQDASYPGGGVVINDSLFNRTRIAILAQHFGYNIVNCAFYHTYFRSFETPYQESSTLNNIPIKFTNCRFFMPAADDVAHIETQLYNSSDNTTVVIDGSYFEFGKATTMSSIHLKIETSYYIISNCRFVMRATGGSFMNYIGLYGIGRLPKRNFLINTISDTQIASFAGQPMVLNSFTDTGGDILAE